MIQDFDKKIPITDEMKMASFSVNLKEGKTRLNTWFMGEEGYSLGAYYVYITKE